LFALSYGCKLFSSVGAMTWVGLHSLLEICRLFVSSGPLKLCMILWTCVVLAH
jgi:hypothetical protein